MAMLLDKVRQINQLVQRSAEVVDDFSPMAETLSTVVEANVYLAAPDGGFLGHSSLVSRTAKRSPLTEMTNLSSEFPTETGLSCSAGHEYAVGGLFLP